MSGRGRRPRVDVATLVTGIVLVGIALLGGAVALGVNIIAPVAVPFAGVLILAGFIGLAVSLGQRTRDGE